MRTNKIYIVIIAIFLVLIIGCANGTKTEVNKIIVEKQVNILKNKYEPYNEIKDSKEVQNAKDILKSVEWKCAKVLMEDFAEYKFYFEDANSKTGYRVYELWKNPNESTYLL